MEKLDLKHKFELGQARAASSIEDWLRTNSLPDLEAAYKQVTDIRLLLGERVKEEKEKLKK